MIFTEWLPSVLECGVAVILAGLARHLSFSLGVIDRPNSRSSHTVPTPRGGGIAIVLVSLVAVAVSEAWPPQFKLAFVIAGTTTAAVGLVDDIRSLSVLLRLLFQLLASVFVCVAAFRSRFDAGVVGYLAAALEVFAVVWSINLFNFMDGINGLATLQAIFVFLGAFALQSYRGHTPGPGGPSLSVAAASAGFLVWNFPRARIFMGDVGSSFLGFAIAAFAVFSSSLHSLPLWAWLALNGTFVADATVTMATRALQRQRVYEAHRSHVYQRVARRWNSHVRVCLVYLSVNLFWSLPWAAAMVARPRMAFPFAVADLIPLMVVAVLLGAGRADSEGVLRRRA